MQCRALVSVREFKALLLLPWPGCFSTVFHQEFLGAPPLSKSLENINHAGENRAIKLPDFRQ